MAYNSTIKDTPCKCGCGKMPSKNCKGYHFSCLPEDLKKQIGSKHQISIRNMANRANLKRRAHLAQKEIGLPKSPKKSQKPIPKTSKKRLAELKIYIPLRNQFLKDNPICKCGRNGCKRKAVDVHHKKGRGILLNMVEFWLPVARVCHRWIEENPISAIELGLSISRLNREPNPNLPKQ